MSEVKTFDVDGTEFEVWENTSGNGEYVLYEDYATLKAERDALAAKVKQLEWDSVFIPKNLDQALTVMGVSLPVSKEEFNFQINRWIQRLVDRVIRNEPDFSAYANQLRAEGVDVAVKELKELAQRSQGEAPKASEHTHSAALYLMTVATKLRKENGHD